MNHTHVAGGVVVNENGLVLVVNTRNTSWSLPKGHVDAGETARDAAIREIHEEGGIAPAALEFVSELGSYDRYRVSLDGGDDTSELKTITMFLFRTRQIELHPTDAENHPEAHWVAREKVAELLTHKKDKEFFTQILNKI